MTTLQESPVRPLPDPRPASLRQALSWYDENDTGTFSHIAYDVIIKE